MTKEQTKMAVTGEEILKAIEKLGRKIDDMAPKVPPPSGKDYPYQRACERCGVEVYAQWSKRGKEYTTNTPGRTDFHNCGQQSSDIPF